MNVNVDFGTFAALLLLGKFPTNMRKCLAFDISFYGRFNPGKLFFQATMKIRKNSANMLLHLALKLKR